jgi:hypothetical protein
MDRKNYSVKAIGLFDTIGSYFVDIFYNHHYLLAREAVKNGKISNITDGYRSNVLSYMNGVSSRDDLCKKVIHQLHEFYQKNSGFGSVVLSEFQDRVLSQFIPPEYYRDFAEKHKDKTLKEIVIKTVNELGETVVSRGVLPRIIDDHMNRANVSLLQDKIVDIFIIQREDYYSKFAREISNKNAGDTVDKDTVRKIKDAYVSEKKKASELTADRDRALFIIQQLISKLNKMEAELKELRAIANKEQEPSSLFGETTTSGESAGPLSQANFISSFSYPEPSYGGSRTVAAPPRTTAREVASRDVYATNSKKSPLGNKEEIDSNEGGGKPTKYQKTPFTRKPLPVVTIEEAVPSSSSEEDDNIEVLATPVRDVFDPDFVEVDDANS